MTSVTGKHGRRVDGLCVERMGHRRGSREAIPLSGSIHATPSQTKPFSSSVTGQAHADG